MSIIKNLKHRFFARRRAAEVARVGGKSTGNARPVNLANAGRIVLLIPADSATERKAVDKWRERMTSPTRRIKLVGVFAEDVGKVAFDFTTFSPATYNWFGAPEGPAYQAFQDLECDLLLRLGPPEHALLDYLAAVKRASVKVGPWQPEAEVDYDLQFDAGAHPQLSQQLGAIEQIFSFTNASIPTT